jgi:putative transposase
MRFQAIKEQQDEYEIPWMCKMLEVSRSGYYRWLRHKGSAREREDEQLRVEMRAYHKASRNTYGSPRLQRDLAEGGRRIGRNRVMRLMRQEGLSGRRKRKYVHTTNSKHRFPVAENILDRNFTTAYPNEAWVGDITYMQTNEGWVYLAVLLDLYSRKVVGYAMDSRMKTDLPLRALRMAYFNRRPAPGLIHHTDRGSQYASIQYRQCLNGYEAICSMSRRGECWDNAVGESFFGRLKDDLLYRASWSTRTELIAAVQDYIDNFYNSKRRHSAVGFISPEAFEAIDNGRVGQ